jgi:carbon storage regulator
MLVFTRGLNERVMLGTSYDQVAKVVVLEIRGDKVKLGFDVPKEWILHREEVYDAIVHNKAASPAPAPPE